MGIGTLVSIGQDCHELAECVEDTQREKNKGARHGKINLSVLLDVDDEQMTLQTQERSDAAWCQRAAGPASGEDVFRIASFALQKQGGGGTLLKRSTLTARCDARGTIKNRQLAIWIQLHGRGNKKAL